MEIISYPERNTWEEILKRPTANTEKAEKITAEIFKAVKNNGDQAVKKYTDIFDGIEPENFIISDKVIEAAANSVSEELKQAIQLAKKNIERFHEAQKTEKIEVETVKGVKCWQEKRPIQKVGLYIPGGTARYFQQF